LIAAACLYGLVSGFNDGGTLLASFTSGRVISPRLAVLLLAFVPAGAVVLGTAVARTVGVNVIDLPAEGVAAFLAIVLLSVAVVLFCWLLRTPTSMTLALVGAMLGWVAAGHGSVHWSGVARVVIGIPASVLLGGALAALIYRSVRLLLGGVPHRHMLLIARLQVASAALQAFAYGANDMAKTVGLIAVAEALHAHGAPVSFGDAAAIGLSFASFLAGTLVGGWRLASRVGFGVFRVRPVQAMTQQTAAGVAVAALSLAGAPVSTTQTINGALVGVGASLRASAVRWGVVREMLASWLLTLPLAFVAAALARLILGAAGALGAAR
jgi:PiT family inorganic phosphate transporter